MRICINILRRIMTDFEKMISTHKQMIKSDFKNVSNYLLEVGECHDNDKVEAGYINEVYQEHFPKLKQIEFGTPEYHKYEQTYFKQAHAEHAQNRHHYYNPLNKQEDINLFDVLEAMIDIRQSQRQYADYSIDFIMKTFKDKGVLELDIEKLAYNTLLKLEQLDEE